MKSPTAPPGRSESLPLVPLRDMVVFPHMMAPFVVGRDSSIRALEAALATPVKRLFLAAQKDPQLDEPEPEDIYEVGVVATVAQSLKLPNGHIKVMVEGVRRGRIVGLRGARGTTSRVVVEPRPARAGRRRGAQGLHGQGARRSSSSTRSCRTTSPSRASPRR